jgi:hypothetical protein
MQIAAMVPVAFRLGREELMRLLALVRRRTPTSSGGTARATSTSSWEDRRRAEAPRLARRAADLAGRRDELCREQVAGPFDRLMAEVRTTFASRRAPDETETPAPAAFAEVVEPADDETPSSPTSSTESPDGTAGTPRRRPPNPLPSPDGAAAADRGETRHAMQRTAGQTPPGCRLSRAASASRPARRRARAIAAQTRRN